MLKTETQSDTRVAEQQNQRPKEGCNIIHFPRNRIVRTILKGNRVYSVEWQEGWDETPRDPKKSA